MKVVLTKYVSFPNKIASCESIKHIEKAKWCFSGVCEMQSTIAKALILTQQKHLQSSINLNLMQYLYNEHQYCGQTHTMISAHFLKQQPTQTILEFAKLRAMRACMPAWFTCQIFNHSSYKMLKEICILYYYTKNSTLYLISQLYLSYVYVSYIKIVLYFISILHVILKQSVLNFAF